jgi:hypothetical protein
VWTSPDEQATEGIGAAGADTRVNEHGSGISRAPALPSPIWFGRTAPATRSLSCLDRQQRSVSHLLEVIEDLSARSAHLLAAGCDRHHAAAGNVLLENLGAVVQIDRALISERTNAVINAAKSKASSGTSGICRCRKGLRR